MATISTITSSVAQGGSCTITGTGFGVTQGASKVYFFPALGYAVGALVTSWSDTQIIFDLPGDADITTTAFATVVVSGVSVRSPSFSVTAAVTPKTDYASLDLVSVPYGSTGTV
jgi:hypothetical protein